MKPNLNISGFEKLLLKQMIETKITNLKLQPESENVKNEIVTKQFYIDTLENILIKLKNIED